jgi:hypothetical protein
VIATLVKFREIEEHESAGKIYGATGEVKLVNLQWLK